MSVTPAKQSKSRSTSVQQPPQQVRRAMKDEHRKRTTWEGLASFLGSGSLWLIIAVAIAFVPWWAQIPLALFNGLLISIIFVVGHDAAHGALFPKRWMNRLAGRLGLLPALHPLSSWVHSHNRLHHAFTNIKEKDSSFPPLDPSEYRKLNAVQRWMTRRYRTWYGLGFYYFMEVWLKWELLPSKDHRPKNPRAFRNDRLIVLAFTAIWLTVLAWGADWQPVGIVWNWLVGFALPQFVWNWLIGFIIFQQHTHPRVAWFSHLDNPSPTFFQMQVQATPYLHFPKIFRWTMRQIMEHTAHHTDPLIPLYHLPEAQQEMQKNYRSEMVRVIWTPQLFLNTLRVCRLYDYTNHCWTDYDGTPTTPTLFVRPLADSAVETPAEAFEPAHAELEHV